jgi:serine/threonine-protein kinase
VWLARDAELDTLVAIKVFKPDLTETQRERMRREVLLGRTLQHPGLVRVFELIDGGDRLAVAMEWVPEGSLAQRLEAGPLPVDEVVRVAEQVLEVLAYLHEHGVVHRDVKPSNLLVDSDGRMRLADLGLARPLDDERGLTKTLAAVGTPAYMSPEQIRGAPPTPAADLYGLGVTLYQLVTGALPFSGTSEFDVANKHLTMAVGDPRKLRRECPVWLAGFILRLLEKAPRDRFAGAEAARAALGRRRRMVSPRLWRRQTAWVLLLAGVTAAGALVAGLAPRAQLASVTVTAGTVTARDGAGRALWERPYSADTAALVADVLGDREPEVVVSLGDAGRPSSALDLLVLDGHGSQQAALASAASLLAPPFDVFSDRLDPPKVSALDLDWDGRPELVWTTSHQIWYPTVVGIWNPRAGLKPSVVLVNSGRLDAIRAADLDGDGQPELVVAGINNPLGWQQVIAVVKLQRTPVGTYGGGASPDLLSQWTTGMLAGSPVVAYTLVGTRRGGNLLVDASRTGITVEVRGEKVRLDPDGNPAESPQYGRGPGPRRAFWNDLAVRCLEIEAGRGKADLGSLDARHSDVLREPPMRLAAYLLLARSLANGGDHAGAVSLLRAALAASPGDLTLLLRLGEQIAIGGDYGAATAELERASQVQVEGRSPFDAQVAWGAVASLAADERELARVLAFWRAGNTRDERGVARAFCLEALWAFCRGRWDDASLRPAPATPDLPWVEVLRQWAALERTGAVAIPGGVAALASNPEIRSLARLVEARTLLRTGRAGEARARAADARDELLRQSRTDVLALAWLALAHRVSGEAALAVGAAAEAAEHFRAAARIAPRCWFGRPPPGASLAGRAAS